MLIRDESSEVMLPTDNTSLNLFPLHKVNMDDNCA